MAIRAIIFDMDGVIYLGNTIIPGAKEALDLLRSKSIKAFFLTNACTRSRKMRAQKLIDLGLEVDEKQVYTTSYASAKYIYDNFGKAKVFYIGGKGVEEEMREFGIEVVETEDADFVTVGLDTNVDYRKLSTAFRAIQKGAKFIASNIDPTFPVEDGELPGAGAFVAFLECCTRKKPFVIGKPNAYMVELILKDAGLEKSEVMIVGDRVESDILVGKRAKIKTCLVLSGVTKKSELKKLKKGEKPDYVLDSVAGIGQIL